MAELALISKSLLTKICNAIRTKKGKPSTYLIPTVDIADEISSIESGSGVDTSDLTASKTDVLKGKVFIGQNGDKLEGAIETNSVSNVSIDGRNISVSAGYYPSDVSKSMNTGSLNTPTLKSLGSSFSVLATVGTAGYLDTTDGARAVYKAADLDSNLSAENIKSGVTIFGVEGSYGDSSDVDVSGVTATAADVLSPKVFVDQNGKEVTGTIASRSKDDVSVDGRYVAVPSGYYDQDVSVGVGSGLFNNPIIEFDSSTGKITGTSSVFTSGYMSEGYTKTARVSPVGLEPNLIAENIKGGISIFGVEGSIDTTTTTTITEDLDSSNVAFDSDHNIVITTSQDISSINAPIDNLSLFLEETGYGLLTVVWIGIAYCCFVNIENNTYQSGTLGVEIEGNTIKIPITSIGTDTDIIEFLRMDWIGGGITYIPA